MSLQDKEMPTVTLEVTEREANLILNALTTMPWRDSNEIINKLAQQLQSSSSEEPSSE